MTDRFAMHILILDDEPFVLKLVEHMLSGLGYAHVTCHTNGADALSSMDRPDGTPDVIFLDINMPGMDGVEFVRHLAGRKYAGHLILLSAEDELMLRATEKLASSYQQNVKGRLQKPPKVADLKSLLEQCAVDSVARLSRSTRFPKVKSYDAEALRTAILQDQLVNYYQPKVSIETGELIGVETLVRWQHPVDGLVPPDRFIHVAEAYQLIDDLTRTVIKNALQQAKVWFDAGLTLRVAINVSMDNLMDLAFADFVIAAVTEAGVPYHAIGLEVTESRLMQNITIALDVLARLHLKRFQLSIDDFGTGHSSLAQLRDFPFDELKIDRSFTHRAWQDPRLKAIFEASVDLASHLNMVVVAEGIEDIHDWQFLRNLGCSVAQGYFVARPMPPEQLTGWLQSWQIRLNDEKLLMG